MIEPVEIRGSSKLPSTGSGAEPEPFGTLDDLPESADVSSRAPRIILLVVALVAAAVLAVVVVVFALGTVAHVIEVGGAPKVVTLATAELRTGLDLPDDTRVLASTQTDRVFTGELLLPTGELPDFPLAGYGPADAPSAELAPAIDGESVVQYYAAASSKLEASAALVQRDAGTVLVVDVRAVG